MAELMTLEAEIRQQKGSKAARRLRDRKVGKLPAIVYGHGQEPVCISLNAHDFVEALHHGHRIFDVQLPGGRQTLLVKDLQYDHFGKQIIHADLMRVDLSERVTVTVPLELRGTAKGSHEGGIVDQMLDHLEIECGVTEIPEVLVVSIKELGLDQMIHAKDVELPAGVVLKTNPEALICLCHLPKVREAEEAAAPAEGVQEPEVITERKPTEEETETA
ncbi:MAG TPA: 50S ribosomal protein L25 [Anaerohalosphaeraceae bacterium]|nr:50S ribosomal protein L25 [Anaerohalosphaeraceae bacterium]